MDMTACACAHISKMTVERIAALVRELRAAKRQVSILEHEIKALKDASELNAKLTVEARQLKRKAELYDQVCNLLDGAERDDGPGPMAADTGPTTEPAAKRLKPGQSMVYEPAFVAPEIHKQIWNAISKWFKEHQDDYIELKTIRDAVGLFDGKHIASDMAIYCYVKSESVTNGKHMIVDWYNSDRFAVQRPDWIPKDELWMIDEC